MISEDPKPVEPIIEAPAEAQVISPDTNPTMDPVVKP